MITHKAILYGCLYGCIIYTFHFFLSQMRKLRNHGSLMVIDTLTEKFWFIILSIE